MRKWRNSTRGGVSSCMRAHGSAFTRGGVRYCHNGRAAFRSSTALTAEMMEKIERLHAESEARQERMLAVSRTVAAPVKGCWIKLISRLHGHEGKMSQTVG